MLNYRNTLMNLVYANSTLDEAVDLWAKHFYPNAEQVAYATYRHENTARKEIESGVWHSVFSEGKRILDIGCGTGYYLYRMGTELNIHNGLNGIDISFNAVRLAKQRLPNALLQVADAAQLPFSDESMDLVTAYSVMQYMECPKDVIHEIFRILRPGGYFILTIHRPALDVLIFPSILRKIFRPALKLNKGTNNDLVYASPISRVRQEVFGAMKDHPLQCVLHSYVGVQFEFYILRKLGFGRKVLFRFADVAYSLPFQYYRDLEMYVCLKPCSI